MANRKKKPTSGNESIPDGVSGDKNWWKTPAIIVGILTLIGTIIAALPEIMRAYNETRPAPTPVVMVIPSITPATHFCDGFFVGDAVEVQSGIPKTISAEGKETVDIKLMDGSTLVGGIKFITKSKLMLTADQNCTQIKPPFPIDSGTENTIKFGTFVLQITYTESSNSLELNLKSQ